MNRTGTGCRYTSFAGRAVLAVVLLWFCSLLLITTTGCQEKKKPLPSTADSIREPYQEFSNTSLFLYDSSVKVWKLDAEYMRKGLSDTARILVVPVKLTLYDSTGITRSIVLADSGHIASDRDSIYIWDNVYIETEDKKIRSQSLWWSQSRRRVGSLDYVEIRTSGGDVLRGKGLDAHESFSTFSMGDVTGEFPKFRERAGGEDLF